MLVQVSSPRHRQAFAAAAAILLFACTDSGKSEQQRAPQSAVAPDGSTPARSAPDTSNANGSAGSPPLVHKPAAPPSPASAHPCRVQGDKPLPALQLRALGTEPFWAARIDGRCVTYSTPEDQAGTRVWTRFSGSGERGEWSGHLGNLPFILRTRPEAGCSDGMSDNRYPIAVTLTVRGEERTGCAEPLDAARRAPQVQP